MKIKKDFNLKENKNNITFERVEIVQFEDLNEVTKTLKTIERQLKHLKIQEESLKEAIQNMEKEKIELEKLVNKKVKL